MTADDFAGRVCAALIRRAELTEDGRPHRVLHEAIRAEFEAARAELRAEWQAEAACSPVQLIPNR